MNYDNPAARLFSLIEQGKKIPNHSSCRAAWKQLLEVDDNNAQLMSRLGKVMELPELAIQAIQENFPQQVGTWSHWETQIDSAFISQELNGQWATFIDRIDSHSLTYLKISAELLHTRATTKNLLGEEIRAIRDRLEEILTSVMESDVSDDVKKYLARNIRKMISSIDEYRLTGALPLLDSMESTVGHVHLDAPYRDFLLNTEIGKRLLETLSVMANVVTVAVGLPQLSQGLLLLSK